MSTTSQSGSNASHTACKLTIGFLLILIVWIIFVNHTITSSTIPANTMRVGQVVLNPIEWVAEPLIEQRWCTVRENKPLRLLKATDFDYIFEYINLTVPSSATDNSMPECPNRAIIFQSRNWFDRESITAKLNDQAIAQRIAWVKALQKK